MDPVNKTGYVPPKQDTPEISQKPSLSLDQTVRNVALKTLERQDYYEFTSIKGRVVSLASGIFQIASGSIGLIKDVAGMVLSPVTATLSHKKTLDVLNEYYLKSVDSFSEIIVGGLGGIAGVIHPILGLYTLSAVSGLDKQTSEVLKPTHPSIYEE